MVTVNSEAAKKQIEREKSVLGVVYFDQERIPPSPSEAEEENVPLSHQPKSFPSLQSVGSTQPSTPPAASKTNTSMLPINPALLSNLLGSISTPIVTTPNFIIPQPIMRPVPIPAAVMAPLTPLNFQIPIQAQMHHQYRPTARNIFNTPPQTSSGHGWPKNKRNARGK